MKIFALIAIVAAKGKNKNNNYNNNSMYNNNVYNNNNAYGKLPLIYCILAKKMPTLRPFLAPFAMMCNHSSHSIVSYPLQYRYAKVECTRIPSVARKYWVFEKAVKTCLFFM